MVDIGHLDVPVPAPLFYPSWKRQSAPRTLSFTASKAAPGLFLAATATTGNRLQLTTGQRLHLPRAQGTGGALQIQHCRTTAPSTRLSGKEKSFLLTLISLYAYIHNFKVVSSRKYWIKNTPMFA